MWFEEIFEEYWYLISFTFIVLYFLTLKRDELAVGEINIFFISIQKMAFIIVLKEREILFLAQYYNIINALNPEIF